LCHAFAG